MRLIRRLLRGKEIKGSDVPAVGGDDQERRAMPAKSRPPYPQGRPISYSLTEQGVRNAQDSPKRADAFREMAKKSGANVKDLYWTLGQYDAATIIEAPDDTAATAVAFSLGKLGNIRTQMLPAFSAAEMQTIIGKMA